MSPNQIDEVFGIPVIYREHSKHVAHAVGLFRKRIIVGVLWKILTYSEQRALLYHEAKHCLDNHLWERIKLIPVCWSERAKRIAHEHELSADRFAFEMGHGPGLLLYLSRFPAETPADEFHPSPQERRARLRKSLREHFHVAA